MLFDAKVAELADALDLGSSPVRGGGSTPPFRTLSDQVRVRNYITPRVESKANKVRR